MTDYGLHVNAEVFDFFSLHSTLKWNVGLVLNILEELHSACPSKTVTQSKWNEITADKLSPSEAICCWSTMIACKTSILNQVGEWIDVSVLGVLLICQCYQGVRARSDSFHRSEILAQSVATAVNGPGISPSGPSGKGLRASHLSLSKLVRDEASIVSFIQSHVPILLGVVSNNLVPDAEFEVTRDDLDRLSVLLVPSETQSLGELVLSANTTGSVTIVSEKIASRISWCEALYPQLSSGTTPACSVYSNSDNSRQSLTILNQSKATVFKPALSIGLRANVYIVNCSESTIYIAAPVENVHIVGCVDCEIVLLAARGTVVVSYADKLTLRCLAGVVRFESSTDCSAYIYTSRCPMLMGDTRGIVLAPFNVLHSQHSTILASCPGLHRDSSHAVYWSEPVYATLTDSPFALLPPEKFRVTWFPETTAPGGHTLAVVLPEIYSLALKAKTEAMKSLKADIMSISTSGASSKLNAIMSGHFREWVSSTGKVRVIADIVKQAQESCVD